jgi:DNA replication protein DnaC
MNLNQTISKLNEMKLYGMSESLSKRINQPDHKDLSFEEFFSLLVDDEYLSRKNKKYTRLLRQAKLKIPHSRLEELDYTAKRGLLKTKILNLQNTGWLDQHQNILITGPTGVGKTYLACAFGAWACYNGYTTLYFRWPKLLGDIYASRGEGNYLKHLNKLARVKLLIIDDFGTGSMTDMEKKDFFEVIEDRYMTGSTIITSQLPIKHWHEFIAEETIADAICDRIIHVAHKFEMKGESMRKKQKKLD